MVHCMRNPRILSTPTKIIVADFFVRASLPFVELCLEDTAANTKGKRKQGERDSEVAHKWAQCLHNSYRLGGPQRFKVGDEIRKGPQTGRVATYPQPLWWGGGGGRCLSGGGRTRVTRRSTHAPPGMHMQPCSAALPSVASATSLTCYKHIQSLETLPCYILCSVFVFLTAEPCFVDHSAV